MALRREEVYRIVGPAEVLPGHRLHVVYLLHGNGGGYKDWPDHAPLAQYARRGFLFVMPEGRSSYWINSATVRGDRYEDFVTHDLIEDAERGLPADRDRSIVGVSMGGFGALVLALRHSGEYSFVGALSPPVDVPERPFTLRRVSQSLATRGIFGAYGSSDRNERDPFWLVRHVDREGTPFLYLGVGKEPLAEPISRFEDLLSRRRYRFALVKKEGGHGWQQWNLQLEEMFGELEQQK